jgi:hypothetical protein
MTKYCGTLNCDLCGSPVYFVRHTTIESEAHKSWCTNGTCPNNYFYQEVHGGGDQ